MILNRSETFGKRTSAKKKPLCTYLKKSLGQKVESRHEKINFILSHGLVLIRCWNNCDKGGPESPVWHVMLVLHYQSRHVTILVEPPPPQMLNTHQTTGNDDFFGGGEVRC